MADHTHIEWTDATWNPITGCSVHSAGCTNCYAMKLAGTRLRDHPSRAGLTRPSKAGPVWTNEQWLLDPIRWKRPRRIFVCAHADLFHENVPDAWIDRIFAVMALCPQHQFQVLTKRSARMRDYLTTCPPKLRVRAWCEAEKTLGASTAVESFRRAGDIMEAGWPLPNVWLGVSVEDQRAADERIPDLLATPAAVRWLSCEPLLGPVDLTRIKRFPAGVCDKEWLNAIEGRSWAYPGRLLEPASRIDWVVAGGESGPGARPMHPDWARSLRDQCAAAGVPFLFKQWGEWGPIDAWEPWDRKPQLARRADGSAMPDEEWHDDGQRFKMIGKKAAGRLLDGVQHDGYPA
jgi:protein gp37